MTVDKFKMSYSQTGNYWKMVNGKRVFYNKSGKQISQSAFLKAEDAYIDDKGNLRGNKTYIKGSTSGRYYKVIDGERHYYAADGTEINEKYFFEREGVKKNEKGQLVKTGNNDIQKKSAKQILTDLKKAIKGKNNNDAIKTAIAKIDNPEELKELESLLAAEGYKADDMYSAVEKFLYKELSDSSMFDNSFDYLEETVQKWIQNGTLVGADANKAQARMAARVIRDGGDGMGTDCDEIKRGIEMIKSVKPTGNAEVDKANARQVLAEVERIIKNAHGESLEEYLKGEMWDGEVKELKASLAANKAMSDENNVQAAVDLVIKAVKGAGTDVDQLKKALNAITTREERIAVNKQLEKYCKEHGIKIDKTVGQDALQAIMYDELDTFAGVSTDHKEIRKFNEMLIKQGAYNKEESAQIRAQQAAKQIMEGDSENIMDAVENIDDKEVLKALNQMLTANKFNNLDDLMEKKNLSKTEQNLVNAKLASKNLLSDEKAAQVAYDLLLEQDYNSRAAGFEAIRKNSVHKLVDEKLKENGKSLDKILLDFNKEKANRKAKSQMLDGQAMLSGLAGYAVERRSDKLRENTDMSDNLYLESDTAQEIPEEKKAAYDAALAKIEGDLNKLKEDYQAARDDQGMLSGFVNAFASVYNLGTTRDEIEARIEHDEETVRLLKLAAEGKLTKTVDGKQVPVSFEEIFNERQSAVISANQASLSKLLGLDKPKEETKFDEVKVTAVSKQAEQIAAMNIAKDLISDSWSELNDAISSKNTDKLTAGIISTMKKLKTMTGGEMTLDSFGYVLQDGLILDKNNNPVSAEELTVVANKLKTCISDTSKALYGQEIPLDANNKDVSKLLDKGYETKMEEFKEQYRAAFGQKATDEMIEDYLSTISTGVTIINIGAAIGAAILTAGYGSFAVFAAVGGASMALNTVEHSTDANGLTRDEMARDAEQAMWDGALAAVGVKVGKYAEGFATSEKVLAKNAQILSKMGVGPKTAANAAKWVARVEAAGGEISSDTIQSLAQMYCMEGEFDEESFVRALIMSAGFNTAGHFASALKGADVNAGKQADVDGVRTADSADGVKSADEGNAADAAAVNAALEGTVEPVKLKDHKLIVNGQEVEMPKTIEEAKKLHDDKNFILTDNNGYKIFYIKDTNGNDLVQIEFDKMDNFIIRYENTYDARGNQTSALQVGKNDKFGYNQHFIYNSENTPIYMYQKDANDNIIGGLDMQSGAALDAETVMKIAEEHGMTNIAARVELEGIKPQDKLLSEEFKSAMKDLEESVKSGKNNTVGELVESNPVFAQFKDEFADLSDYKITFLDDATNTNLGQHSKKQIALNFDALKENEEAFVNTLLHEAEHARQHKRFYEIQFKPKAERTPAENRFYEAYKDMQKTNKARADFYEANKDAIDKFARGEKLTAEEETIVEQYKKLYDSYKSDALEVEAREAGAKAAEQYRVNKEVTNGQETEQGARGVQKDDSAGHQDGAVGSAARNENAEGTAGTKGPKQVVELDKENYKKFTEVPQETNISELTAEDIDILHANGGMTHPTENSSSIHGARDPRMVEAPKEYNSSTGQIHGIDIESFKPIVAYNPESNITLIAFKHDDNGKSVSGFYIKGKVSAKDAEGIIEASRIKEYYHPVMNSKLPQIKDINYEKIQQNIADYLNQKIKSKAVAETPATKVDAEISAADKKYLTKPSEDELPDNMEFADGNENVLLVYDGDTIVKTYEYDRNKLHQITESAGEGRVETTFDSNGNVATRIEYDEAGNGNGFITVDGQKVNVGIQNILDENGNVIGSNLFNAETTKPISTRILSDDGGVIETKYNPDGKPVERNEFYEDGTIKSEVTIDPESEIVLTQKEYAPNGTLTNDASFDPATKTVKGVILDTNGNPRSYEYDTEENFRWTDEEAVPVEDKKPSLILDPNAVEPKPGFTFVDPNEVTPNPNAKIIDPNAVESNTTPLIKPEFESPVPREVVKYDETPDIDGVKATADTAAGGVADTPVSKLPDEINSVRFENGKMIINGQEFEMPKTLEEAEKLAAENSDYFKIVDNKMGGKDFGIYDSNKQNIGTIRYDKNGNVLESQEYTYNQEGKQTAKIYKDADGKVTDSEEYIYDLDDEVTAIITKDKNGNITGGNAGEEFNHINIDTAKQLAAEHGIQDGVIPGKAADETPAAPKPEAESGTPKAEDAEAVTPETGTSTAKLPDKIDTATFENGKMVINGQEFEMPKTVKEAEELANGENIKIYRYSDGEKDFEIYDSNNNNIGIIRYDKNGNISKGIETPYKDGNQTSTILRDADGKIIRSEEYTYENGNRTSIIFKDADGKVTRSEEYTYNQDGNLTSTIYKDADGKITKSEEYTYNQDGNRTSTIYKDADDNVTSSEEYTYNQEGRQTAKIYKDADGNITHSTEYIYNDAGEITAQIYKNADSNIESGYDYVNNKSLNQAETKQLAAEHGIQDGVIPGKVTDETPAADAETKKSRLKLGPKAQAVVDKFKKLKEKADNLVEKLKEKRLQHRVKRATTEIDANGNTVEITYLSGKNDNKRIETVKNPDGKTIEVRRFDSKGRLTSRKVTTDKYDLDIKYDKNGNEISFVRKIKNKDGQVITTEKSKDKGEHSFGYTNADGNNVNVIFEDGKKVKTEVSKNGIIKSETEYTQNGTIETTYPDGKKPNQWNESTTIWKDNKGNIYRQKELLADGSIYEKITYDDGTKVEFTASNGGIYTKVTKQGEEPINYKYNYENKLFEAIDKDGNVTHRGKMHDGTWTELDEAGKPIKTYRHKDNSHSGRKLLGGAAVAGVVGTTAYGISQLANSDAEQAVPEETPGADESTEADETTDTDETTNTDETPGTQYKEETPDADETDDSDSDSETQKPPVTPAPTTPTTPGGGTTPTTPTTPDGGSTPTTPTTPDEGTTPTSPTTQTTPDEGTTPTSPTTQTTPDESTTPTSPTTQPEEDTTEPQEKPTIKDPISGRDPETGEKREITPPERKEITDHINEAKNKEDIKLIQKEIRSFKRFPGRKNLRRALRAKRRALRKPDSERRQNKLEKRMEKVEMDNIKYSIKEYDYTEPPKKDFEDDNTFLA